MGTAKGATGPLSACHLFVSHALLAPLHHGGTRNCCRDRPVAPLFRSLAQFLPERNAARGGSRFPCECRAIESNRRCTVVKNGPERGREGNPKSIRRIPHRR